MYNYFKIFLLIYLPALCFGQSDAIEIEKHHAFIDSELKMILIQEGNLDNLESSNQNGNLIFNLPQGEFILSNAPSELSYSDSYEVWFNAENYRLYFTALPLISINTSEEIKDEPKVHATLSYADEEQTLEANIGIEIRGGYSVFFPKKTFDIEFWTDDINEESLDVQFQNLRSDDDWVLDALYNEPLRIRSTIAHKLWIDLHQLYYQEEAPDAKSGADLIHVEMFIDGSYEGVYALSEQIDRKLLKLKKFDDGMRGELFKGISNNYTTFNTLSNYNNNLRSWGGYEFKYPKQSEITDWSSLYEAVDFAIRSSDEDFTTKIWQYFDKQNFMDYYIYVNIIKGTDNRGKNIYLGKYDVDEKYFYSPWDLDGCFGNTWEGLEDGDVDLIMTNHFYDRVIQLDPGNFIEEVSAQWFAYRENILSIDVLKERFDHTFNTLNDNNTYERESLVYDNYNFDNTDLNYIKQWIEDRIEVLDVYFGNLSFVIPDLPENELILYPNPTDNKLFIHNYQNVIGKSFELYNSLGESVLKGEIRGELIQLGILPSGLYFFEVDGYQSLLQIYN